MNRIAAAVVAVAMLTVGFAGTAFAAPAEGEVEASTTIGVVGVVERLLVVLGIKASALIRVSAFFGAVFGGGQG